MSTVIHGFTLLPVNVSSENNSVHYLYIKEHTVREVEAGKAKNKTLFVVNVPPYFGEAALSYLFTQCGKIKNIYIHASPSLSLPKLNSSSFFPEVTPVEGFKVAYIVFDDKVSVQNAVSTTFAPQAVPSDALELTGLNRWCTEYRECKIDVAELEAEIEQYMKDYDENEAHKAERLKQQELQPDEEGWITVTRRGKMKGNPRTEEHEQHAKSEQKKKRKDEELSNFYSFQVRESKMKHVAKLRQQFKDDKEKVARMKVARKFKPY